MFPKALSFSAERLRTSSAVLVFLTSTLYLTVAQAAVVLTTPLVTVAVLGASVDVTVTLLDICENLELELTDEWPDAVTVSVNPDKFSPTVAVKVHVPVAPGCPAAASGPGGQLILVAVSPGVPAGQVEPVDGKMAPYWLSQIWSITRPPAFEVLVIETV
jgi:hypothetical protein